MQSFSISTEPEELLSISSEETFTLFGMLTFEGRGICVANSLFLWFFLLRFFLFLLGFFFLGFFFLGRFWFFFLGFVLWFFFLGGLGFFFLRFFLLGGLGFFFLYRGRLRA